MSTDASNEVFPRVDLCMCVFVCVGLAPAARVPRWHSCIGTEAAGTPAVRLASLRPLRAWSAPGWEYFQSLRRTARGRVLLPGETPESQSPAQDKPICPGEHAHHTHTHNATTWKQPTAVLQNHLISCTVYEGSSVGAALVLTLKRNITRSKSAFYEIEI